MVRTCDKQMGSVARTSHRAKKTRKSVESRRPRRQKMIVRAIFGVGAALFFLVVFLAFAGADEPTGVTETDSWDLPSLEGEGRVTLAQFEGKPTVAAFFASWCTICKRELPGFAQLSQLVGDEVNFVGINTMNHGSGLAFARQMGIDQWPLARDIGLHDGRQLATNFGARGSPTTVLYDADGAVVDVTLGGMTAAQLADKLNRFFQVDS